MYFTYLTKVVCLVSVLALAAGCATNPNKITASYVPQSQYGTYSCDELQAEISKVTTEVDDLTIKQRKCAKRDKTATIIGLTIFWPALFVLAGKDHTKQLAQLMGEQEALLAQWEERGCEGSAL